MNAKFNLELLWSTISNYIDYPNLSNERKRTADAIFKALFILLHEKAKQQEDSFHNKEERVDILSYPETQTELFREDLGNWLIDNRLNLVFSNVFGFHMPLRIALMSLHAFKDGDLHHPDAFKQEDAYFLSDLFTGLHYGSFLSGAGDTPVLKCKMIVGQRYFMMNKDIDQNRLTYNIEIDPIFYDKKDAINDYKTMIERTKNFKGD